MAARCVRTRRAIIDALKRKALEGVSPIASGVLVGVLTSIPDAIVTKAYAPILITGVVFGAIAGWVVGRCAAVLMINVGCAVGRQCPESPRVFGYGNPHRRLRIAGLGFVVTLLAIPVVLSIIGRAT